MQVVAQRSAASTAERRFFAAMTFLFMGAVVLGFGRTFFFKPWFPQAQQLAPAEGFFLFHALLKLQN